MAFHKMIIRPQAEKDLERMDPALVRIILRKLRWYVNQENPLRFASRLKESTVGQYRFRFGSYRAIVDINQDTIIILRIGHRSVVYR